MKEKLIHLEVKIYEFLGVRRFRSLVFKLEKWIHRKDKGTNINYHIASHSPVALDAFIKYLFYNGTIHARNLIYFCVYAAVRIAFAWKFGWYDIVLLVLAIKDAYCVMLQRYNYIRIRERERRLQRKQEERIERRVQALKPGFLKRYDCSFIESDLAVVDKLRNSIARGESIIIGPEEQKTLERLAIALQQKTNKPSSSDNQEV